MENQKLNLLTLLLGGGIVIISLVLQFIFPSEIAWMPEGFSSPIIAFEFLLTSEEVLRFFGPPGEARDSWVEAMVSGHKVDGLYLVVYGFFIVVWGWRAQRSSGHRFFFGVMALAVLASVSDLFENRQLVQMATSLEAGVFDQPLKKLFLFTWLKWGSLTLALGGLSLYFWKNGWLGKAYAVISAITLILGIMAFFNRSILTTYFTLGITLLFLFLIVYAVISMVRSKNKL